jgi:DNA-binding NarL/FixJ family response regulator
VTTLPEKPEVIVMDIEMPKMDGIQATKEIKTLFPDISILMLTVFDDEDRIFDAILTGASGYMLKDEKPHKIINAIEDVREGRMPMSPLVATKALRYMRQKPKEKETTKLETFELTNREIKILEHLSEGKIINLLPNNCLLALELSAIIFLIFIEKSKLVQKEK